MTDLPIKLITCKRCGRENVPPDKNNPTLCEDCVKAENNRTTYYRQHQSDWVALAAESGLDLWERQPGETQWEFTVWTAYRDSYPGKQPSYRSVAEQLDCTYEAVRKISQRWGFQVRMQAWMKHCDEITLAQRRVEILDMNAEHIKMAKTLREKISVAINKINPAEIKVRELASLMRVSSELEREARIDTIAQDQMRRDEMAAAAGENPDLKKDLTKQDDIRDIIKVLAEAGVLDSITKIGVRKTETTQKVTETIIAGKEE